MGRSFASRVSHPRLKWVVLVLWLVLAGVSAPLAGGLTDEQENDIAAWLPSDAESTRALERQVELGSDPDVFPAVVVYERTEGLTPEDGAAVQGTSRRSAGSTPSTAPWWGRSRPRTARRCRWSCR